jgi:hypothetical protein
MILPEVEILLDTDDPRVRYLIVGGYAVSFPAG